MIQALSAGYILHSHAEIIAHTINKEMDKKRTFAVWRVDPLWKPITKKVSFIALTRIFFWARA